MTKELKAQYNKKYRDNNLELTKNNKLFKRYGITLEYYNNLLIEQNLKCSIYLKELNLTNRTTHIDHCHSTGKVRGILCNKCNLALGLLNDNKDSILRMFDYLNK